MERKGGEEEKGVYSLMRTNRKRFLIFFIFILLFFIILLFTKIMFFIKGDFDFDSTF